MQSPSKQFITEITADHSPTLRLVSDISAKPESMHHSGGAAAETKYIYGEAILKALSMQKELRFLVVGLGLGYIEILISSLIENAKIESYEIDTELRTHFLEWVNGSGQFDIYNQVCKSLGIKPDFARQRLSRINLDLKLNLELNLKTIFKQKSHVICFDAFSQKTSGSLWTEEFLDYFILNACEESCIFTTYACTGLLNRTLKKHGFKLFERSGFTGKRDSTLAVRGLFL